MIPLVAPCITNQDRNYMAARAWDGRLFADRTVREFEAAFAERVGCVGAVAVCSGTTALRLALDECGVKDNEHVVVPTYACSAIANGVRGAIEPCDGSFDVASARMTFTAPHWEGLAAVFTHAFGTPYTADRGAMVEDFTLSLGGVARLSHLAGVCSTHSSKMLSTGRGGVVFSNDESLLDGVREQAYYDYDSPNGRLGSWSLGMSSMQAALGLSQLRQLDSFIARRREIAAAYSARFDAAGIECPDPDCGSVFFRYLVGVDDPAGKMEQLAALGVEAGRGVYPPLHRQLGLPDDDFPGATACVNRLLSVPCHPSLTDADVAFVAEKVLEVCA